MRDAALEYSQVSDLWVLSKVSLTQMGRTGGERSLGTDPEFSCGPVGLETSGDVTEALGYVDQPGVQRRNLGWRI